MHNKFNDFILSIVFDVNQFNVGKNYERAYIILFNYRDWLIGRVTDYEHIVNKVQFEKIIDHLMFYELNGQQSQEYANLKKISSEQYSINLISIYKLYLILKVRTRQIGCSDLDIAEIQNKLAIMFSPIDWDEKTKQGIVLDRELPKINQNENSAQAILPILLLILTMSLSKIFPSSTFIFFIQIFMFLVVGALFAKLIKYQKMTKMFVS